MEEGQERDSEDSPTDTPVVWMSERNDQDTKFVRAFEDDIPTQNHPQTASKPWLSIVQERNIIVQERIYVYIYTYGYIHIYIYIYMIYVYLYMWIYINI
jgi:hypothetical protein